MSIYVQVSETYDLSTKVGKLALLGIHTPYANIIEKCWPGLLMQCKYVRPVSCDVVMACASMLPADPLQVGVESGQVSPADMFNPILYRAVSNDSMSTIEGRIHAMDTTGSGSGLTIGPSVKSANNGVTSEDNTKVYYGLLSDRHGWRHAMPQQGLEMRGLRPLVFSVLQSVGQLNPDDPNQVAFPNGTVNGQTGADSLSSMLIRSFRGSPQVMPRLPCTAFTKNRVVAGFGDALNSQTRCALDAVPPIYVAAVIMPPAKLTTMYYRLHVVWNLEFSGLRSQQEIAGFRDLADASSIVYHSDYETQSKSMTAKASMADAQDAELTPIMQG